MARHTFGDPIDSIYGWFVIRVESQKIERVAPLASQELDNGWAVFASKGGADDNPGWYYNLLANPDGTATGFRLAIDGCDFFFLPGVPRELEARIFVPFYTTRSDGSGVGLALARQVMIAHGGFIRVGDAEGGGAKFTLVF